MKAIVPPELEMCRVHGGALGSRSDWGFNGMFELPGDMKVICSDGMGWDHVSVSFPDRCPTWDEMCMVKNLCWNDDECVVQYHPPRSEYVNCHPFCLHLWKNQRVEAPIPDPWLVGPKTDVKA